jgi:hypothetical protein
VLAAETQAIHTQDALVAPGAVTGDATAVIDVAAPVTVAVPEVQARLAKDPPPIEPVVPLKMGSVPIFSAGNNLTATVELAAALARATPMICPDVGLVAPASWQAPAVAELICPAVITVASNTQLATPETAICALPVVSATPKKDAQIDLAGRDRNLFFRPRHRPRAKRSGAPRASP